MLPQPSQRCCWSNCKHAKKAERKPEGKEFIASHHRVKVDGDVFETRINEPDTPVSISHR